MPETAKVIRLEPEVQRHVRSRLVRLPAIAHALHERGKALLGARLEAYFDAADDVLFEMADNASSNHEQNAFFDSMREVRVQRKSMEKRFFDGFDEAFARLVAVDERDSLVPDGELSADALSLVQNDDLEQLVAQESTVHRANRELAMQVGMLGAVLRKLVPQPVNEHTNPFGPEILCGVFMAQVKRLDVDIKAKLALFNLFDRVVIGQLVSVYKQLEGVLAKHGVGVSLSRSVRPAKTPPQAPSKSQVASSKKEVSGTPQADKSPLRNSVPQMAIVNENTELMKLLAFVQKLPASAVKGSDVSLEQILDRVQQHKGQVLALTSVQRETIKLVSMLFDFILRDRSLAQPIKELLARLQIPVLKVALIDSEFLTDKNHCARRLLNEISVQAVGWQASPGKNPMNEPLAQCIASIVESLVRDFEHDTDVFKRALLNFTSFVEKERRRAAILEKRMVDAEDGKARAEQARKKVAAETRSRVSNQFVPKVLDEFVTGPWSNVLFVTGLKNGFESTQWVEHLSLLDELIWSVQPKRQAQDRQALIVKGPKILQSLRSGLDEVSYNPFEVSDLLIGIEELHVARIRGENIDESVTARANTEQKLESLEMAELAPASVPLASAVDKVQEVNALAGDDPHMLMVASFTQGSWFDIATQEGAEPLRCRLAAFIKPTGKYIFVNRSGMKAAERSRQELAVLLKKGLLRPVDSGMLFDRALENIVTGLRNAKPASPLDELAKGSKDDLSSKNP